MEQRLVPTAALAGAFAAVDPPAPFAAAIARRDFVSWGGYALLRKTCPSGTSNCGTTSCCPEGYSCSEESEAICCPSRTDCSSTVKAVYACADRSWTLWRSSCGLCTTVTFCCASDEVGTYDGGGGGLQCIRKDIPVPKSIIVSSLVQQTASESAPTIGTALTTTGAGGRATGTSSSGSGAGSSGSSSPSDSNSGSPGLPQGAVVAIAVLATALGLLAAFFARFVYCRRKKAHPPVMQPHVVPPMSTPQPFDGQQATAPPPAYVTRQPQTQELHAQTAPVVSVKESRSDPRFELAGQPRE